MGVACLRGRLETIYRGLLGVKMDINLILGVILGVAMGGVLIICFWLVYQGSPTLQGKND